MKKQFVDDQPLWIVGKVSEEHVSDNVRFVAWEFIGVFDDEAKAVDACKTPDHFVGPVVLNEQLPEESEDWPGAYFPLANCSIVDS